MRSHLENEIDDEYLDDPIKLFDLEQERVHFGIQSQQFGITNNYASSQPVDNITYTCDAELLESSDDDLVDFSVSECLPVSVKLVDCKKYPWFFKKYAHQIMNSTDIYDLVSDSDNESDIVYVGDNYDHYLSDNASYNNNVNLTETLPKIASTIIAPKPTKMMKCREDFDLITALSQKSSDTVDFKRNKGLIGMTITQKIVQEKNIEAKKNETIADQSYIKAANKTLSDCGTELIPVSKENINPPSMKVPASNTSNNNAKDSNKLCVKFNFGKISDNLIDRIIDNKIIVGKQGRKDKTKVIHKQKVREFKIKYGTDHIINIVKPKKQKKRKIKARKNVTLEVKATGCDNKINEKNDRKESPVSFDLQQVSKTTIEDTCEPHSPILPCNTLKKNNDFAKISLGDKSNGEINIIHASKLNPIEDNKKAAENIINSPSTNKPSYETTNNNTIHPQPVLRDDSQTKSLMLRHEYKATEQLNDKGTIGSERTLDQSNKNVDFTNCSQPSLSKNTEAISKCGTDNMQIKIVSVKSIANCSESDNSNPTTVTKPSNFTAEFQNEPISLIKKCNRTTPVIKDLQHDPINNDLYIKHSTNSANSNYRLVHNNYASSILLRPNQPNNLQNTRFRQPTFNGQNSSRMLVPIRPQSCANSYFGNHYSSPYTGRVQGFMPRFANPVLSNYRFPPPYESVGQPVCNPAQAPPYGWQHPNVYNKKPPSNAHKIYPCRFPGIVAPTSQSSLNAIGNAPQINNNIPILRHLLQIDSTPQPQYIPTSDNFPTIVKNKESFVKNKNKCNKQNNKSVLKANKKGLEPNTSSSQIITSKMKMAETLERAVKKFKRVIENDITEMEKESVNPTKRVKLSVSQLTTKEYERRKQIEQEKGYSPPILPIPTYEKIMGQVSTVLQKRDGLAKNIPSNIDDRCVQGIADKLYNSTKREEARKISLEEYKKRTLKNDIKENLNKKVGRYNNDNDRKDLNELKGNEHSFSTESDLGYDSDSTVIL